ncbi:MAG: Fic family protein [Pseudomonadota bacterium]
MRQFDFLHTSFVVSEATAGLDIDHDFICILNAYATRYISLQPGRYRRHYNVVVGTHTPSEWPLVREEMEAFIDTLHENWASWDAIDAASYALWGVNHVHPFCEGNGRTARALSYYVLCKKLGQWLPGSTTVLELIRTEHRNHHCEILQRMHDARERPTMVTDLAEMKELISALLLIQLQSANPQDA